jgi:hypothetical protein
VKIAIAALQLVDRRLLVGDDFHELLIGVSNAARLSSASMVSWQVMRRFSGCGWMYLQLLPAGQPSQLAGHASSIVSALLRAVARSRPWVR